MVVGVGEWCDKCSTYVPDQNLIDDSKCPTCNTKLRDPRKAPWHFKLLVIALILYLAFRFIQIGFWIAHRFH